MSDVDLTISANVSAALKEMAGFRKQYADLVRQIEKPLSQVNSFRALETSLEQTGRSMISARDRVRELGNAMASTSAPSKSMIADYKNAIADLRRLERQEGAQIGQLNRMRAALQASGIDTRNLAAEQRRLAQEMKAALAAGRADAGLTNARSALGVGAIEQTQRELLRLRQQYRLVASDATLTAKQRSEAETAYRTAVDATLAKLREMRLATNAQAQAAKQAAAADAARQAAARSALGVGAIEREQRKLVELRQQYRLVASDTTLTARQRSEAEANYRRSVDTTLARLRELRSATVGQANASRQAALEAARNDLGVNRARVAAASIRQLQDQYRLLQTSGRLTGRELAIAQETLTRRIRETRRELAGMAGDQQRVARGMNLGAVAGLAGGAYASASGLRAYAQITDASKRMDSQLKLATSSQEEFNRAQQELYKIAQNTSAPIEEVVKVYARLSPALDEIGRKGDATKVVDALSKALKINGSTTAETASTLLQFSQAMGSGVLRGEEFNAIAEAAPPLLRALAKGLNVPTGALRGMAAEGLLTSEVITDLTVKALPELTEAAKKLPDTVDGALTRMRNDVLQAFGEGDSSALIDAINKLRELLTDPATVEGLNNMAATVAKLAGWAAIGAREISLLAKEVGYAAANANGYVDELAKLEKTLQGVKQARDGGAWMGRPTATLFMTKQQLDDWVKELEGKIDEVQAKIAGLSVEAYRKLREGTQKHLDEEKKAATEQEALYEEKFAVFSKYVADVKAKQGEAVKNAEEALKKQTAAENKAAGELKKAKDAQLDTQKRYADALAGLNGSGEASYSGAQDLRIAARAALASGDVDGAKRNAQAALEMLQELAEAGENTFGFAGFIKSLQQIEEAADQINVDKAKKALDEVKQKGIDLKKLLDSVKKTIITVKLDDAALELARKQLQELAKAAGGSVALPAAVARPQAPPSMAQPQEPVAIPVEPKLDADQEKYDRIVAEVAARSRSPALVTPQLDPAAAAAAQQQVDGLAQALQRQLVIPVQPVLVEPPPRYYQDGTSYSQFPQDGYATGGYTGPGGKWQPAGVVHAGEHVQPQEVVREPGALAFFERIRRNGYQATMRQLLRSLRGYASGGPVIPVARALPSIPSLSPELAAAAAGPSFPHLGSLDLNLGGQSTTVYVESRTALDLRRLAMKKGRTQR